MIFDFFIVYKNDRLLRSKKRRLNKNVNNNNNKSFIKEIKIQKKKSQTDLFFIIWCELYVIWIWHW